MRSRACRPGAGRGCDVKVEPFVSALVLLSFLRDGKVEGKREGVAAWGKMERLAGTCRSEAARVLACQNSARGPVAGR